MTSPHHLAATAAGWSLHMARTRLQLLAEEEAAQITAEQLEAPEALRSPAWGRRHALGGHGDPTPSMVATADRPPRLNRWALLLARADRRITGVAAMLRLDGPDPLRLILDATPRALPGTAALVARHLADEDTWIRNAIGTGPARAPLPGIACPHCGERQLYVQTAGPVDAWTVVCATGRLCIGQGCPCGMPGAVEGVAHVWPRSVVISAIADARTDCRHQPRWER
ncbi:hypothetical protein E1193_13360 [Micromonospora sp. KC606]|uniref:hypothetical protein n=1 Tax=Micromonospora sp. KC606 TaxID=2530379 RepID=UPI0010532E1F|nr:hypothetical protein [Micromonospora sp. KC606]TDC81886.1 hypothetical protein E1193_13360 [Micromonospora sp. KC606]